MPANAKSQNAKLSVVIPVRDGQNRIESEVERLLDGIADIIDVAFEVIVVDDGSRDSTPEILDELSARFPQVRNVRHRRSLGMEAAGQTGLERAIGELVFIQEDDSPLRLDDLRQLYQMGRDQSVVAARAQSRPTPANGALLRRLRAWGARTVGSLNSVDVSHTADLAEPVRGLQMVRRPHLQFLSGRGADSIVLESERFKSTRL